MGRSDAEATTAIHFDKNDAVIKSLGGTIVLAGNYDSRRKIDLFSDNDPDGNEGVRLEGQNINIISESGVLKGTLESGSNVGAGLKLELDQERFDNDFYLASAPVKQTLVAYQNGLDGTLNGSNAFLQDVLINDTEHGRAAEQAARLGMHGGVLQTALAANNMQINSMAGRAQINGANFSSAGSLDEFDAPEQATGSMWITPVYSRINGKGFAAEGVDYGSDIDLYGMTVGSEFALAPQAKLGAVVSVGKGDTKGNGVASGVSNDFKYYGLGAYVSTKFDNFTLMGDVNYSRTQNDITANNNIDSLNASTDSTVWSLGLTGKGHFNANGINVEPHLGFRYQHLSMEDYAVNSAKHGKVADYHADDMDIFSIPVGVSVSKTFVTDSGWKFKPEVDLTLRANFGDTDAKGNVAWSGIKNSTPLNSEVVDPFNYSVNAGFTK